MGGALPDDELAARWEACRLGRSITHLEHVRVVRVLLERHGEPTARLRVHDATRRNCEALGVATRYDAELTDRWVSAIAAANAADPDVGFDEFLRRHPELRRAPTLVHADAP